MDDLSAALLNLRSAWEELRPAHRNNRSAVAYLRRAAQTIPRGDISTLIDAAIDNSNQVTRNDLVAMAIRFSEIELAK